jgi:hypothetical protein
MGLFKKRSEHAAGRQARLPSDIISMMERFGRNEYDPQAYPDDPGAIWTETQEPLYPLASSDPSDFIDALAQAVEPTGGWATFGAAHTVWNLVTEEDRSGIAYSSLMD